ncbi:EAL domain-containing protein [Paractinoplanes atraurantiacus]|uniref:Diguanylate cyclase (GGDEF) domain-containing protein n=1 Tax=Paractinoplanes atraurantiacus TaxID=1036182 RepID=A0A285JZ47_9ACTN|nr:EAL domain-containing protein [Actinoplanes atraurantiacus]SNY65343.1 diguanylate cyclase (GGDEF) domain-containing protein [Actinoplanes atraurantiacus]
MSDDGAPVRIVGWGWFRLPGERRRFERAEVAARRALGAARTKTELARIQAEATHTDALTGLPNRPRFLSELARLLDEGPQRLWVFLLDLDGFKAVNESRGQEAGSDLLVQVAERLRAALPATSGLARVAGDAFAFTYAGMEAGAARLLDQVEAQFERPFEVAGGALAASVSVGYVRAGAGADAASLLLDAESAMHRSKAQGGGGVAMFEPSMRVDAVPEPSLLSALAEGKLGVTYQPVLRLRDGRLRGAEAVVRWEHPLRGVMAEGRFLLSTVDAETVRYVGAWLRREVLRRLAEWRADGTVDDEFAMSVPVAAAELADPDLVPGLVNDLERFEVPPAAVVLEVPEAPAEVLARLSERGIRVLIDDDERKLRSAVAGLTTHRLDDDDHLRRLAALGRELGKQLRATGISTHEQRDALASLGFEEGQGPLWDRALPPGRFAARWGGGERAAL